MFPRSFLRDESGSISLPWLYAGILLVIGAGLAFPSLEGELNRLGHASGLQFRLHVLWPF